MAAAGLGAWELVWGTCLPRRAAARLGLDGGTADSCVVHEHSLTGGALSLAPESSATPGANFMIQIPTVGSLSTPLRISATIRDAALAQGPMPKRPGRESESTLEPQSGCPQPLSLTVWPVSGSTVVSIMMLSSSVGLTPVGT